MSHSFVTPRGARQVPLPMEFSRYEYWSGLPFPLPEDLPNTGIELASLASPALAGRFSTTAPPGDMFSINRVNLRHSNQHV